MAEVIDYVQELQALGYEVGEAMPGVLYIQGLGLAIYVSLVDTETLDSLIDPELHKERLEALADPPQPEPPKESLEERVAKIEATLEMPPE